MSVTIPQRVVDRVWDRVEVGAPDECWPWRLSVGSHGYGLASWKLAGRVGTCTTAHRVAWVAANGSQIPDGLVVDHMCHNRVCCNPAHLRLLTMADNTRESNARADYTGRSRPIRKAQQDLLCEMLEDSPRLADRVWGSRARHWHRHVAASLAARGLVVETAPHTYELTADGRAVAESLVGAA